VETRRTSTSNPRIGFDWMLPGSTQARDEPGKNVKR